MSCVLPPASFERPRRDLRDCHARHREHLATAATELDLCQNPHRAFAHPFREPRSSCFGAIEKASAAAAGTCFQSNVVRKRRTANVMASSMSASSASASR